MNEDFVKMLIGQLAQIQIEMTNLRQSNLELTNTVNKIDTQTKLTNEQVALINERHKACPGDRALVIQMDDKVDKNAKIKIAGWFKTSAYIATTLAAMLISYFQINDYMGKQNNKQVQTNTKVDENSN